MKAALSTWARIVSRLLEGSFSRISTLSGPFASTASTFLKTDLPGLDVAPQRLSDATTSGAPSVLPLWNLTLLRRWATLRLPTSRDAARSGRGGTGRDCRSSADQ